MIAQISADSECELECFDHSMVEQGPFLHSQLFPFRGVVESCNVKL